MVVSSVGRSGESEGGVERRRRVGRRAGRAGGSGQAVGTVGVCRPFLHQMGKWGNDGDLPSGKLT